MRQRSRPDHHRSGVEPPGPTRRRAPRTGPGPARAVRPCHQTPPRPAQRRPGHPSPPEVRGGVRARRARPGGAGPVSRSGAAARPSGRLRGRRASRRWRSPRRRGHPRAGRGLRAPLAATLPRPPARGSTAASTWPDRHWYAPRHRAGCGILAARRRHARTCVASYCSTPVDRALLLRPSLHRIRRLSALASRSVAGRRLASLTLRNRRC